MTATGHAVIGTVIAATISNPLIAIPLAIVSHLAADVFPHWDVGTNGEHKSQKQLLREAAIDVIIGFLVAFFLLYFVFPKTNYFYTFIIILFAQSFDWAWAPYYFFKIKIPPFTWAHAIGLKFDNRLDKPWGIINQVAVLAALVVIARLYFY
jgi:hypothetical protein